MRVPFCPPFLAGDPRATGLLPDRFRSPAAWREEVEARRGRRIAPDLLQALQRQHAHLPRSAARDANLEALARPGTVVAVTGQQVGLYLGPLYTVYKAASAIAWARAIERETGARCVPLFWLQTEDHDFAEIATCAVPAAGKPPLRLSLPEPGARCSVAHVALPPEIEGLNDALEGALAGLPKAGEVMASVREAYQPGRPIAQAFAHYLASVFADEGLVLLDPRCPELATLALGINCRALECCGDVDAALARRGSELGEAGFIEQVHVRKGSPLVFFHADGPLGPRHRLQRDGAALHVDGGGAVALPDVLAAAAQDPLRLSTSALLRPVVQDALLPSVVYVGGPAEMGYLAQTAPLYPLFDVRPSLPAPRARFRLIDARTQERLDALGLQPKDVEAPRDGVIALLGAKRSGAQSVDALATQVLGDVISRIDALAAGRPDMERAARRTRLTVERAATRFARKHAASVARRESAIDERVDRVQSILYPGGPQERVHSLPWFAARFGLADLKAAVFGALQPGDAAVKDLRP